MTQTPGAGQFIPHDASSAEYAQAAGLIDVTTGMRLGDMLERQNWIVGQEGVAYHAAHVLAAASPHIPGYAGGYYEVAAEVDHTPERLLLLLSD